MLQTGKTMTAPVSNDFDGVVAQLAALRDDMTALTGSVTALAERRGRKMATDISDSFSGAMHSVESRGIRAEAGFEKSVTTHPMVALALAACVGLLIGAVTRRA